MEPHVSGGVPLLSTQGPTSEPVYYINDILGTTLAVVSSDRVEIAPMTAFGKPTGVKPASAATDSSSQNPLFGSKIEPGGSGTKPKPNIKNKEQ